MIIGVDPGVNGAIAAVEGGRIIHVIDMPVYKITNKDGKKRKQVNPSGVYDAIQVLQKMAGTARFAVVEEVWAHQRSGRTSSFRFGHAVGTVQAVLSVMGIQQIAVLPEVWKKDLTGKIKDSKFKLKGGDKKASVNYARQLPGPVDLFTDSRHDRAEAALIAYWGETFEGTRFHVR